MILLYIASHCNGNYWRNTMKTSSIYLIALVSALSVTSVCTADAFIESSVISTTKEKIQISTTQSTEAYFFNANWKINNDGQAPAPVNMLNQISANYFDNNWALPRENTQAYPASEVAYAQLNPRRTGDSIPVD